MKIMIIMVMITVVLVEPDVGCVAFTHGFADTGGFVKIAGCSQSLRL